MCICNGERFIGEQIASIVAQTRRPAALIVCDDASTDRSLDIVESLRSDLTRAGITLHVHRNPARLGISQNFEFGMRQARADFLFTCDQDDIWYPTKIQTMSDLLRADEDILMAHCDADIVDASGNRKLGRMFERLGISDAEAELLRAGRSFRVLMRRNIVTGAAMAVRSRLLNFALPIPPNWLHDEWFAIAASLIGRTATCRSPLIAYRQHHHNAIGAETFMQRLRAVGLRSNRDHCERLSKKWESAAGWALQHSARIAPESLALLADKSKHLACRARMSETRGARIVEILREARTGRYHLHSRGVQTMLRDVLAR